MRNCISRQMVMTYARAREHEYDPLPPGDAHGETLRRADDHAPHGARGHGPGCRGHAPPP